MPRAKGGAREAIRRSTRRRRGRGRDLAQLAEALLVRHLQESWPRPREESPSWFWDCDPLPRHDDTIRTVAVVGAGASIPMRAIAKELAKELEDEFDKDKAEREVELDRLENVYGMRRDNFETRLTAICRTPEAERKVREEISRRYRLNHPSLLTYELLAHLLHHRYLDTIISFNFDELLDQSIEDELGANEYTRVVTEGDFDPHQGVQSPLYIKMHGTATEPESLRFTKERYYWTPRSIVQLVEEQFNVEHLVLINLGFTMSSFDFQHLLRKPRHLEIYHLDPRELSDEVLEAIESQRRKARERKETSRPAAFDQPKVAQFPASNAEAELGAEFLEGLLGELIEKVEELCDGPESGPVRWRSTLRHQAVVKLLEDFDIDNPEHYTSYLRRRAVLEIAFAAAKGRGVVSIASMVNDRCGRYYDLYRRSAGAGAETWPKLCEAGGLTESPDFPDTYEVLPTVRAASPRGEPARTDIHRLQLADPAKLAAHTAKSLDLPENEREMLIELLTETLQFLQNDTEIEVHSRDDRVCSKIFAEPVTLKTVTALQGWTRELLRTEGDYDELWVIAETGDWLGEPEVAGILSGSCTDLKLLRAFDADFTVPGVTVDSRRLPWGRHNRHMTIICNGGKPRAAIYFVRRLRAATVTPVYLHNSKDLQRVASAFTQLWDEADIYERELEASKAETAPS